jgi:hypothetical protein
MTNKKGTNNDLQNIYSMHAVPIIMQRSLAYFYFVDTLARTWITNVIYSGCFMWNDISERADVFRVIPIIQF